MPLLRKGPAAGAKGERSLSNSKSVTSAGQGSGRPASKADSRKAPTPVPPAGQQQTPTVGIVVADDYAVPMREVVQPTNQLQLTSTELEEEVGRSLTAGNPAAPTNLVRYSFRERGYRTEPIIDQQLQHLSLGGCLMHCDSDEVVREQRHKSNVPAAALAAHSRNGTRQAQLQRGTHMTQGNCTAAMRASEAGGALRAEASLAPAAGGFEVDDDATGHLRNQFNYADRAAQTAHGRPKDRATMTEPPPTASTSGSCSRWEIYEAYVQDQERQRQTEELARQKAQVARRGNMQAAVAMAHRVADLAMACGEQDQQAATPVAVLPGQAVKLLERMVQQNTLREEILDFKYWDDPADSMKPEEGTLLPLWGEKENTSFTSPRIKHRAVTALAWSPRYFDLFAVGYGSFDFLNPTTGLVACYSLKNPGHPEFCFGTSAGVMCLDFHPDHPNLLAVGCYDGALCIFDLRSAGDKPAYQSGVRSGKHSDPVWQVCWQRTDSHELALCSISTDGRVTRWSVSKNELSFQDILQLRGLRAKEEEALPPPPLLAVGKQQPGSGRGGGSEEETGEQLVGIAGGCCIDFNREQDYLFVVGSEDGTLYKCSTAYASEYLQAYRPGHRLPVYAVRWNGLHSRAFLSAGADWKVKLWDSVLPMPVLSFDLRAPVGDVAWAPFSSTVFAAVTDAGKVHVFDLAQTRAAPVCVQRVARKTRLTKLAFNPRHPVLLVGTEQGGVTCLKLSPNLRRSFNPEAAALTSNTLLSTLSRIDSHQLTEARAVEAGRLEAVLELAGKCNAALREEDWELM